MKSNAYHFITHWTVEATPEEVYRTIQNTEALTDWWSKVYLQVEILKAGGEGGIGKEVAMLTTGWLPYKLKWKLIVRKTNFPHGSEIEAVGDFVGRGIWSFQQRENSNLCDVTYDWKIEAEKPLLKIFSFILKPIFKANHHWAMRQGEIGLKKELVRRRTLKSA